MNLGQIVSNLNKHKGKIVEKLSIDHWPPYFLIKDKSLNKVVDDKFKSCFCSFYRMNGPMGLNDAQKNEFFRLLSLKENDLDLEKILRVLHEIPGHGKRHRLFISFGTKLLHTIDNNLPIYDRNIDYILELPPRTYPVSFEERIKNRISIYNELKNNFDVLMRNYEISAYLKTTREEMAKAMGINHFEWKNDLVSNTKLLDSSLWALYDIIKSDKNIKCLCNNPLCAKCLLVNCKDSKCKIHLESRKVEFRARHKNR